MEWNSSWFRMKIQRVGKRKIFWNPIVVIIYIIYNIFYHIVKCYLVSMKVGMIDRITIFYVPTALFDRSLIHIYLICLSKHYANPNRSSIIGGYEKSFCLAQMQTLQAKNSESLVMLLHIHRFDSHIKIIPNWLDTSVLFCHKIK